MKSTSAQRAIKCTCSHCRRETYFSPSSGARLHVISTSTCSRCGHTGVVFTLDAVLPEDAVIQDTVPGVQFPFRDCSVH